MVRRESWMSEKDYQPHRVSKLMKRKRRDVDTVNQDRSAHESVVDGSEES